jgi:hypothetical protein
MKTEIMYHVYDKKIKYKEKIGMIVKEITQFPTHTLLFHYNKTDNEVYMTYGVPHSKIKIKENIEFNKNIDKLKDNPKLKRPEYFKESFKRKEGCRIVKERMNKIFLKNNNWKLAKNDQFNDPMVLKPQYIDKSMLNNILPSIVVKSLQKYIEKIKRVFELDKKFKLILKSDKRWEGQIYIIEEENS